MRAFAVGLVIVTFSAFAAFVWFWANVFPKPLQQEPPFTTTTPLGPMPRVFRVTVASEHGWDVVTRGEQVTSEVRHETGTCADPFGSMDVLPHAGRTRVTLEVEPEPHQQLVINAVRVYVAGTREPTPNPTYLYHCAGPAAAPATRVQAESRGGAMFPVEGPFPLQVPADGYRQDIEVELTGQLAADWQVEVDYVLDGEARTQPASSPGLVTEPRRTDATGHWVWCDRQWHAGDRC